MCGPYLTRATRAQKTAQLIVPDEKLEFLIFVVRTPSSLPYHQLLSSLFESTYIQFGVHDCHYGRCIGSTLPSNSNRSSVSLPVISGRWQLTSWSDWHHPIMSLLSSNCGRTSLGFSVNIVSGTAVTSKKSFQHSEHLHSDVAHTVRSSREKFGVDGSIVVLMICLFSQWIIFSNTEQSNRFSSDVEPQCIRFEKIILHATQTSMWFRALLHEFPI